MMNEAILTALAPHGELRAAINMSNFFKSKLYTNLNIINCKINDAYFFGTPKMVEQYIEIRRTYENVICDIDGVLFKHNPHSNTNEYYITLIGNCSDKLLRNSLMSTL